MKKPFTPELLPISLEIESINRLNKHLVDARVKINTFDMMLERSPVSKIALTFFSITESIESTKIEGTQATFDEVVESNATGNTNDDIQEVRNYVEAISLGESLLRSLPISTRMFHSLHRVLLQNSRGQNRSPGEYRNVPNFIGPTNDIADATYIPPEPQHVANYMTNLEKYINDELDDGLDPLIRVGIIHSHFETIHPYLDGNGRLGRILIMLYLLDKKIISKPLFFISEELEKNKYKYYSMLNNLRSDNPEWEEWLEFFLISAFKQATKYIKKLEQIEHLYEQSVKFGNDNNIAIKYIDFIFNNIIFSINDVKNKLDVSYNTARINIQKLVKGKIIYSDDKKRNKIFRFYDLLDVLRV